MAKRMSGRLVALSASAVATIYAAGFALTRSSDAALAASQATVPGTSSAISATAQPNAGAVPVVSASAPSTGTTSTSTTSTRSSSSTYADGTYTGQGTSRRGGVSVSVTIANGTISNVQITGTTTEYPVSAIASLPSAVIKQQSANVNTISGATYSSQAFKQAVQQALARAQAAQSTSTAG